jgi:hypothetical protein
MHAAFLPPFLGGWEALGGHSSVLEYVYTYLNQSGVLCTLSFLPRVVCTGYVYFI